MPENLSPVDTAVSLFEAMKERHDNPESGMSKCIRNVYMAHSFMKEDGSESEKYEEFLNGIRDEEFYALTEEQKKKLGVFSEALYSVKDMVKAKGG
jgi:hypothetical protein